VPEEAPTIASGIAAQPYCWLTTTGLRTGRARTVELWFAADGATVYVLSGGRDRSAWVRNLQAEPRATLRLGSADHQVTARLDFESTDEADRARRLLDAKYHGWRDGRPLTRWAATALPVAFDLTG
jgi:deazaflavin-dependent oxidoreductase (nitroreductase family)